MGAYRHGLLCGVLFRCCRAYVWVCICVASTLHFRMPCSAVLGCLGLLVITTEHFVLTSLISGKAFGHRDVIKILPWASVLIHSPRTCHGGFYKATSGCCPPSFPDLLAIPQTHKTHMEKMSYSLLHKCLLRFHTFLFFKTTSYCGIISSSQQ